MIHLAELIEDEMTERGWTLDDLVMNMGPHYTPEAWGICHLSWEMFFTVREPCVVLGEPMAQQLSEAFDMSPAFFTNFHEAWRRAVMATN